MKLSLEGIAAGTAILVSVAALFVAWDQSSVMRAQQHATVWPMVEAEFTIDREEGGQFISFDLTNVGVGPALLRYAEIQVNGEAITDFATLSERILVEGLRDSNQLRASSMSGVLGAGKARTALKISWPRNDEFDDAFHRLSLKFIGDDSPEVDVVLCYCSVFEQCWTIRKNANADPRQVEQCPSRKMDPVQGILDSI